IDRSMGKDSVSEIENVSRSAPRLVENTNRLARDFFSRGEEHGWVEVALNGDLRAEPFPGRAQPNAPIQTDHVSAGVALEFEQRAGVGAEVDDRNGRVEQAKESAHMRLNEPAVVVGPQISDPTVEDLKGVCAGMGLGIEVDGGGVDQPFQERVPGA